MVLQSSCLLVYVCWSTNLSHVVESIGGMHSFILGNSPWSGRQRAQGAVRRELVQMGDASASLLRFDKALPSDGLLR